MGEGESGEGSEMDGVVDRWWRKRRQAGLEGLERKAERRMCCRSERIDC